MTTRFIDLTRLYSNDEFAADGLWTCTNPPELAHQVLTYAWDFTGGPYLRWHLPVRPDARIYEVHRPADWNSLIETYTHVAASAHSGWELPGPNQYPSDTQMLRTYATRRAVRVEPAAHHLPDWSAVGADYDGIHLSWAGLLASEGAVSELPSGAFTMLRYWASERTLWLRDVFGEPRGLPEVSQNGWSSTDLTNVEVALFSESAARTRLLDYLGRATSSHD